MMLFTDQFRHVLSASDLSLDLLMLRARVYTENYIGVRVYGKLYRRARIRKLRYDRRRIVRVPSRDRSVIVQRLFNDRKTETERELSYDRYCTIRYIATHDAMTCE